MAEPPFTLLATKMVECHSRDARISGLVVLNLFVGRPPSAVIFHDSPDALQGERFVGKVADALRQRPGFGQATILERGLAVPAQATA